MANARWTILRRVFLLTSVLCSPTFLTAQISDNFFDGNFSTNPSWFGDTSKFRINDSKLLQLNAEGAGSSVLITQNNYLDNCEWQFYILLAFSPSSNNHARVYLSSDQADLRSELNGYFLQFGESGSNDAIELFRQNGQELTSICRGTESLVSKSFKLKIKVIHQANGNWEIYVDQMDGAGFELEASGFDQENLTSNYFGFYCKYTKSNAQKFYFDDVFVDQLYADTITPKLENLVCLNNHELEILFSESMSETSLLDTSNYVVSDEIGYPDSLYKISANQVKLHFEKSFENRSNHLLSIQNLSDLSNNLMSDTLAYFSYFEALLHDIVINEIMDDPTPSNGLPEFEYLELFNTSDFDISLDEWTLKINNKELLFKDITIPAHQFLILCNTSAEVNFAEYGSTYALTGFLLPNVGSELTLKNKQGVTISSFNYLKTDFVSPEKSEGGWALEQINPMASCLGIDNWNYSQENLGGSPAKQNSVFKEAIDQPEISSFEFINGHSIQLQFTNTMDTTSLKDLSFYEILETDLNPERVELDEETIKNVKLIFPPFSKNQTYTLSVTNDLKNCLGLYLVQAYQFTFSVPDQIQYQDIIINEILYHPLNEGEEYIELYNRSEKILDLKELEFCLIKNKFPHPPDTTCVNISNESALIFPGMYLVLSRSPEKVLSQYYSENPDNFITVAGLPRLLDDGGIIALKNQDANTIDKVEYDEKMHYSLLNYTEGVALEKTHYDLPGFDKANWMSASFASGFGTPAYENSQFSEYSNTFSQITISPHTFTPNNDGRDDFLKIEYQLEKAGYTANVIIFNSEGVQIKQIVKNELLGTQGFFVWKGLNENSEPVPRGIYIIYIELFDLEGKIKHFKESAVLAKDF